MRTFNPIPKKFASGILKSSIFLFLSMALIACGPSQREQDLSAENNRLIDEQGKLKQQLANMQAQLQASELQVTTVEADPPVGAQAEQAGKLGIAQPSAEPIGLTAESETSDTANEQAQTLSQQPEEASVAGNSIQQESSGLEQQSAPSIAEKDRLKANLEIARTATDELRRSVEELQAQQSTIKAEMNASLAENESLKQRLAQLEGHTETLTEERENLNKRLTQTANELGGAQDRSAELSSAYEVLLQEKSSLAANDEAKRTELEHAKQSLEDAQTEVARLTGARGIYTVQDIDSLSTIAAFFYRDGNQWPKILQANSFLTTNPDLIYSGMVLIIPQ